MISKQSKGIILKTIKWREADLLLTILLSDGSSETFLATNALRSRKRFGGGVLEPSHYISFYWQEKGEGRKLLSEASIVDDFTNMRCSYDHIKTAMDALRIIVKASQEGLENQAIFNLLGNFLKYLNKDTNLDLYLLHFEIRLLKILGLLPNEEKTAIFFQYPLKDNKQISISKNELKLLQSYMRSLKEDYFV